MKSDGTIVRVLLVLAITQLVGWGTIGLPAVVGRDIGADLHMSLPAVFAGSSVLFVTTGLCAPWLARAYTRLGARRVMIIGTLVAAPGFVLLAFAREPVLYYVGWGILGMAGSATLSTGSYILLNELVGRQAKSAIGALMLVTGLSNSIFWPITAFLSGHVGWRGTCLVYAATMIVVCTPLYLLGVPRRRRASDDHAAKPAPARAASVSRGTFNLVVTAAVLNAFVAFGLSAVFIELLKAEGLSPSQAIAFGSMLGVIQIGARGVDFLGGGRWDGITTGLVAGSALPVAMLPLLLSEGSYWAVATFVLLYGAGSGALAVARATIPLVFYDQAEFAKAMSMIALPLNLASAVAPPIMAGLLTHFGSRGVLGVAIVCACGYLTSLAALGRRRPGRQTAAAA